MLKILGNPGHGGRDTGAISVTGVPEKVINLNVGLQLKEFFSQIKVVDFKLTRETDIYVSINDCNQFANDWKADIVLAVHHNGGKGDGFEVIHTIFHGVGEQLARVVAEEFEKLGQNAHWKGVYSRESTTNPGHDFYGMIRGTDMPCIISEFAFLDNPEDFKAIDSPAEQRFEAEALYNGLCRYYNIPRPKPHWGEAFYKRLIAGEDGYKPMNLDVPKNYDKPVTTAELYAFECKRRGT